jgi:hypothetical protein
MEQTGPQPNYITYNTLIHACAKAAAAAPQQGAACMQRALQVLFLFLFLKKKFSAERRVYAACAPGALRSAEINFFSNKNKKISIYLLYWYKSTNTDAALHFFLCSSLTAWRWRASRRR